MVHSGSSIHKTALREEDEGAMNELQALLKRSVLVPVNKGVVNNEAMKRFTGWALVSHVNIPKLNSAIAQVEFAHQ